MHTIRNVVRRGMLYVLALVLVAGYPLAAMADTQEPVTDPVPVTASPAETPTSSPVSAPPSSSPAPVQTPAPAEIKEPPLTYTFNPTTEKWDSEKWQFNPQTNAYEKPPAPIIITPTLAPEVKATGDQSVDKTVKTDVTVDNKVNSDAASGNALISKNTTAGNALTGDATAVANIINVVNSAVATGNNQKIATFTQDIMGDVKGDIVLYPLLLKAMLEQKAKNSGTPTTVNATTDLGVNNTLNLAAKSGNATVDSNTTAGNATTGSATAMANVVNILNSMIAAQDSFIGTINIYGSLEGDILIAPDFIPQMLANNGGSQDDSSMKISKQDTTTIVNNITAVADSGAATVFGNTKAGNATSGDARSNVVIFNVTGHDIVAANSMLVFVNVLGKWVGMIVDAPAGATAAMIGNGVTNNSKYTPDLTINSQSNLGITNTIAVSAESGDAMVSNNTTAGNAVSGQARAMANVANMTGSQLNLSGWFGLLFINVQGDWFGDFGINTPYGNIPMQAVPEPTGPVQFIPTNAKAKQTNVRYTIIDSRTKPHAHAAAVPSTQAVLASATAQPVSPVHKTSDASKQLAEPVDYRLWIIAGSIFLAGVSALGIRRILQS